MYRTIPYAINEDIEIPYAINEDIEREAYSRWNRRENNGQIHCNMCQLMQNKTISSKAEGVMV